MKTLILLLSMIAVFSCNKSIYKPNNELLISCLNYPNNSQLPIPADNYYLRIDQMTNPTPGDDLFYKNIICDTIRTIEPLRFDSKNGLSYGRFVIFAKKDTISTVTELIYKGGSIQINLLLKPSK